jgi:hypothetical protein
VFEGFEREEIVERDPEPFPMDMNEVIRRSDY